MPGLRHLSRGEGTPSSAQLPELVAAHLALKEAIIGGLSLLHIFTDSLWFALVNG